MEQQERRDNGQIGLIIRQIRTDSPADPLGQFSRSAGKILHIRRKIPHIRRKIPHIRPDNPAHPHGSSRIRRVFLPFLVCI